MKCLLLFGACLFASVGALESDTGSAPQVPLEQKETHKAVVTIRIDPLSDEQIKAGLSLEDIKKMVQQQLEDAGVQVDDSISQPILQLRIRSIESGFDVATFFQLSLQEESMLIRNRSVFNAVTWSQASMLCCRPEDLKKETDATIVLMLQTFAKEYIKSLQVS
jgi:hypothetical protein